MDFGWDRVQVAEYGGRVRLAKSVSFGPQDALSPTQLRSSHCIAFIAAGAIPSCAIGLLTQNSSGDTEYFSGFQVCLVSARTYDAFSENLSSGSVQERKVLPVNGHLYCRQDYVLYQPGYGGVQWMLEHAALAGHVEKLCQSQRYYLSPHRWYGRNSSGCGYACRPVSTLYVPWHVLWRFSSVT